VATRESTTNIQRLDYDDVKRRLREFERAHLKATGERLSSESFFERFKTGEFDSRFGMRWAGYCRALERAADRLA
jgi:hypothetical protein